jgi:hypothetical protein
LIIEQIIDAKILLVQVLFVFFQLCLVGGDFSLDGTLVFYLTVKFLKDIIQGGFIQFVDFILGVQFLAQYPVFIFNLSQFPDQGIDILDTGGTDQVAVAEKQYCAGDLYDHDQRQKIRKCF